MITGTQLEDLNPKDLTLEDLKQLVSDAKRALKFVWDHYEELAEREAAYTLYGPYEHFLGAAMPGKIVSKRSRDLKFKTSRKEYLVYELDSEYKLLRIKRVFNPISDNAYHFVELNGIQYAISFDNNIKRISGNDIYALVYKDGKPYYFGTVSVNRDILHAEFYEYVSSEKVNVTVYSYDPISRDEYGGERIDPNAPIGEKNSAGQRGWREEKPMYTDFSKYFKGTETVEEKEEESEKQQISDWIDNILNKDIPDDVAAFCFNLYEEGTGSWSMELIGSGRFDSEDPDWPCDEITDFNSRKNLYEWEMDCSWEDALAHVVGELKEYLSNGKYAELLKSRSGIGVGFVDGDLEILS